MNVATPFFRPPLHIAIVSRNMTTTLGGIERSCAKMANALVERGHKITIFCVDPCRSGPVFALAQGIELRYVDDRKGAHADVRAVREMLRSMRPDVCFVMGGGGYHLFWAVALLGSGVPYICSERTDPECLETGGWNRAGRLACLSGADAIHQLMPEYAQSVPPFLRSRVVCIPNMAAEIAGSAVRASVGRLTLVSVGRLDRVKQTPLLVRAFERLAPSFPNWKLDVWGIPAGCDETLPLIRRSAWKDRITFKGEASDPLGVFQQADVFCTASAHEGFPNTVVEAMSAGLPVVGFAGCPGVNSLVKDGVNGFLAKDMTVEGLAEALAVVMGDDELRAALGREGLAAAKLFSKDAILPLWEDLFYTVAQCKGRTRMDAFSEEPFASMARLSAAARREHLYRDFGGPWPGTLSYYTRKWRRGLCAASAKILAAFTGKRRTATD